jgi:hypothetical protein
MSTEDAIHQLLADSRAAYRAASAVADRFRDIVSQVLGLAENPGDDELVSRLMAAHGMAGQPEATRWRDFISTSRTNLAEAGVQFMSEIEPGEGQEG